jgi:cytochrome c
MKKSGITWDETNLNRFLENPLKTLPGTKMAYAGVKDAKDRADLIAYLKQATRDPAICD